MGQKIKLIYLGIFLLVILQYPIALADSSSNATNTTNSSISIPNPISVGMNITNAAESGIVMGGINMALGNWADSALELAGVAIDSTRAGTEFVPKLAFEMIRMNDDPFSYGWVRYWQNIFAVIYVTGMVFFVVIFGGMMVLARKMGGQAHRTLNFLLADTVSDMYLAGWTQKCFYGIVYGLFATLGIWLILHFNQLLTDILLSEALKPLPFSKDNLVAYVIVALGYMFIAGFMWVRAMAIDMFAAGGLALALLYLIPATEGIAKWAFWRMIVLIFMQPVLIFEAAIGITIIQNSLYAGSEIAYIGLIAVLTWTAWKMTFGDLADKISSTASKVAGSVVFLL